MRFAPPLQMRVVDRGGGLNQSSVRSYNERLVLSLIRRHGQLSRLELGQLSGLSAQTISVIVRALEADSLTLAGEEKRGKVGPPTVPLALNPLGAFAIGVEIATNYCDVVLLDFLGSVQERRSLTYAKPCRVQLSDHVSKSIAALTATLDTVARGRLTGVGIALHDGFDSWSFDGNTWPVDELEAMCSAITGMPTFTQDGTTAAAGGELLFGAARTLDDLAYFHVDAMSEHRLVLNHHVYAGHRTATRLEDSVSLATLAATELAAGGDPTFFWQDAEIWPDLRADIAEWIVSQGESLASAFLRLSSFVQVNLVIINGRFPDAIREQVTDAARDALVKYGLGPESGLSLIPAKIGRLGKAVGAGGLPLLARFTIPPVGVGG